MQKQPKLATKQNAEKGAIMSTKIPAINIESKQL